MDVILVFSKLSDIEKKQLLQARVPFADFKGNLFFPPLGLVLNANDDVATSKELTPSEQLTWIAFLLTKGQKEVDVDKVLQCYKKYMEFVVDKAPSYKQFVNNMQEKMEDPEFTNDMQSLLRPGISFNASEAYPLIYETFIDKMEGKRD